MWTKESSILKILKSVEDKISDVLIVSKGNILYNIVRADDN